MRPREALQERGRLLAALLRPEGGWVEMCRAAVAEGDVDSLEGHGPYWEALAADRSLPGGQSTSATGIASAILSLARALISHTDTTGSIAQVLDLFNGCGLVSPAAQHGPPAARSKTPLARVLREIELLRPGNPSADFLTVLAQHLAGNEMRIVRRVEIPVLFDQTTSGSVGRLTVREAADGPPGLHPDPASMAFLAADEGFQRAIANAWALVPRKMAKRCFLWDIRDAATGDPVHRVAGGSLGLAWFIAIDALRLGRLATLLRPKKLDPLCAVTGRVDASGIGSVEGYENKFKAAAEQGLRVVYPGADKPAAEPIAVRYAATATPAHDLPGAVKAVRNRPNPTAKVIMTAIAAALVSALVMGAALIGEVQHAAVAADVQNLINQSQAQLNRDPRKAALYALAAEKLDGSTASRDNIFSIAEANPDIAATAPISDRSITLLRAGNKYLYAVAGDSPDNVRAGASEIIGVDNTTRKVAWRFQADSAVTDIAVSADESTLAVLDRRTIKTYDLTSGTPVLSKVIAQDPVQFQGYLRIVFSRTYGKNIGTHDLLAITTKAATLFSESGTKLSSVELATEEDEQVVVASHGIDEDPVGALSLLLATTQGRILSLDPDPLAVHEVAPKGTATGTIKSIENPHPGDKQVLMSTSKGLYGLSDGKAMAIPLQGVSSPGQILNTPNNFVFDGGLAVLSPEGLTVAPIDPWATLAFQLPRTGDRHLTSAAMSGDSLAVGDVGGRLTFIFPGAKKDSSGRATVASAAAFSPEGDLFTADASSSPMAVSTIPWQAKNGKSKDPYRIPSDVADPIYVNTLDAGTHYLVAAGQSGLDRHREGLIALWRRGQQNPIQTVDFSGGGNSTTGTPDIVTQVKLLEDKNLLVAYNILSGEVKTFHLPDMAPVASRSVGSSNNAFAVTQDEASLILLSGEFFKGDGQDTTLKALATDDLSVRWSIDVPHALAATPIAVQHSIAVLEGSQTLVIRRDSDGSEAQRIKLPAPTRDIVASPDGKLLATVQEDGTVKVISTADYSPAAPPMVDQRKGATVKAVWAPDSSALVGIGLTRNTRGAPAATGYALWDLSSNTWDSYLCAVAGVDLTEAEWDSLHLSSGRPTLCPNLQ